MFVLCIDQKMVGKFIRKLRPHPKVRNVVNSNGSARVTETVAINRNILPPWLRYRTSRLNVTMGTACLVQ
jgi:hypothetical protein